jgi:hypothetical protein
MIDSPEDAEWPCLRCVWDGRIMVPNGEGRIAYASASTPPIRCES